MLWEPLYDALTRAGYRVLVLHPRQPASWAASLGLRAEWRARYERLLARGRAKKEGLTIFSRTMLKVIFHCLRPSSYDPVKLLCQRT